MTVSIAITGKSGSGKTTITKTFVSILKEMHPTKSILLFDNDLSEELANAFGVEVQNTIYDIKTEKYNYSSDLPENMKKHEYLEWALQDIVMNLYDDVDLITTGYICGKETLPYINEFMNKALNKFIQNYDFVIFDCEYDLKYLNALVDFPIDVTLIIAEPNISSVYSAAKIKESSQKIAALGQLGVILNKIHNNEIPEIVSAAMEEYDLDIVGRIEYNSGLIDDIIVKELKVLKDALKEIVFRLNLPLN